MKLLAFVSDEMYVALADVQAEFQSADTRDVALLRSSPRGAFYGYLAAGRYRLALSKDGFGSKTVTIDLSDRAPHQFRLLPDTMFGYMWPKWVRAGEQAEFRTHSPEQFQLTLWRYGLKKQSVRMVSWLDEHGLGANKQILPDNDFTQDGVKWNQVGYSAPPAIAAPEQSGLYYLWMRGPSGRSFSFPWVVAPSQPKAKIAVLASTNNWNAYNNFGGDSKQLFCELPDGTIAGLPS